LLLGGSLSRDDVPASSRRNGLNPARRIPQVDPQRSHFPACQPPEKGGFSARIESIDAAESDLPAKLSRGRRAVGQFGKEIR